MLRDLNQALDAILAFDEKRQRTGRVPCTKAERFASDVIGHLSGVMRGAWPDIAAALEAPKKRLWLAGWNMPGFMPEAEPAECESFGEAAAYLIEELQRHADDESEAGNESEADKLEALWKELQDSAAPDKPWQGNAGRFAYWIEEAAA